MTVISLDTAEKTAVEEEDLNVAEKKTFSTAKGPITCPIVERTISVGGIDRRQPVAINLQGELDLLGVDFFKDKQHMIDFSSDSIYIWIK